MTDTARNMRDRAVALANQGFSVFPLKAGTKDKPVTDYWGTVPKGQYFDLVPSADPQKVYAQWSDRNGEPRDYNIGICTNDLLVFDIDNKNGKNGERAWQEIRNDYKLLSTLESRTPTGGRHLFYALPKGEQVRSTVSALGEGVDTRGWHGYVVAPGSVVPTGMYEWVRYQGNLNAIQPAPEVLLRKLRASKSDHQKATVVEGLELDQDAIVRRVRKWLEDDAPEAVENAGGDHTTFKVACTVADMGLGEPMCLDLMANHWNPEKAHPPWSIEELELKVANAYAYRRDPVGVSAPEGQFSVVELVENGAKPGPTKDRSKMFWRSFTESADRALGDDYNYLIAGYLERGTMSVLYGDSGIGKTFVALDFAYHVATRQPWNGRKVNGGPVVYVAAEAGESVNVRIAAQAAHHKPTTEPPMAIVPCLVNLFDPKADLQALIELVKRWADLCGEAVALIVLDTLARIMGAGDENSAREMGILVQNIDRLRVASGAHIMLVHHSGKNKANGARGSSALRAAVDTELEVEKGQIKMRKQRGTEEARDVGFRLRSVPLGKTAGGQDVTSCVVELGGTVDFKPQLTNEQQEWVEELREIIEALGLETFTRKDMRLAWGVVEKTARNRAEALARDKVLYELPKVDGAPTLYRWGR